MSITQPNSTVKNMKTNLPAVFQSAAEMFALGAITLTQVAEFVEDNTPLHQQALTMSKVMIYSYLYYQQYEEHIESTKNK